MFKYWFLSDNSKDWYPPLNGIIHYWFTVIVVSQIVHLQNRVGCLNMTEMISQRQGEHCLLNVFMFTGQHMWGENLLDFTVRAEGCKTESLKNRSSAASCPRIATPGMNWALSVLIWPLQALKEWVAEWVECWVLVHICLKAEVIKSLQNKGNHVTWSISPEEL